MSVSAFVTVSCPRRLARWLPLIVIALFAWTALSAAVFVAPVAAQDSAQDDVCVPTQPDGWVEYVVQRGDTLASIARRSDSTLEELIRANCIRNPRLIVVGDVLFVPRYPDPRPTAEDLYQRCIEAGGSQERCRHFAFGDHEGDEDENNNAARCEAAGLSQEICRAIIAAGEHARLVLRCIRAGYEPARCLALAESLDDDEGTLLERCRATGLTVEECRELINPDEDERPCEPDDTECLRELCERLPERCDSDGNPREDRERERERERDDDDDEDLHEICRQLGLSRDLCARLLAIIESGVTGRPAYNRCVAAGIPENACRRIFGQ